MKRTAFSSHDKVYVQYLKNTEKHDMHVQHYHDTYEIYLLLEGRRYAFYDNTCYTLERGDMIICKPFDIHYSESRESDYYERYVLNFREEILSEVLTCNEKYLLLEKINPCVVHLSEEQTKKMYEFYERIDNYMKKKGPFKDKLVCSALFQLLVYVTECTENKKINAGKTVSPQIITAIKFMNENYGQQLTLDDIAEAACVSKYYFSRTFKEVTGATVMEYLNNVRLTKVHNLLIETEYTTDEIAQSTGFSSSVHLIRAFNKAYGVSPKNFRKMNK